MILSCNNIAKSFITEDLLKDISFMINEGEKVALVGINGAGKTTLFRIITGDLAADQGQVILSSNATLGYLKQNALTETDTSLLKQVQTANEKVMNLRLKLKETETRIHDEKDHDQLVKLNTEYARLNHQYENLDGYQYDSLVRGVLVGLGFAEDDFGKPVSTLSGGQKTRVALAMELIKKPDLLMLDEPTNHLDIEAIGWLETYLKNYPNTVLIISHDRYFLDKVVGKIVELEHGKSRVFNGNYTDYTLKKDQLSEIAQKHYDQQQKNIKHQEEVIAKLRSFNREKSIKRAESREKLLDKIERIEKPLDLHAEMHLKLVPRFESGQDVLSINGLSKAFGSLKLFEDLSLEIKKGEKVALIGDNGTGKSTLFKIINQLVEADEGSFRIGSRVKIGYYDQEHQLLNPSNNLIDEIAAAYPTMTNGEIRNILASYLFKGDDVFKKVASLSGGEKGRLTLVKLMLSEANFLILDEPTNHLDLVSKEILEKALNGYQGTLLMISHDRYFVNKIADKILHLNEQKIDTYLGNYDYYISKRLEKGQELLTSSAALASETKLSWMEEKARKAEIRRLENLFQETEKTIHQLEEAIVSIDQDLLKESIYTDHVKAHELMTTKEEHELSLLTLYENWESYHSQLEAYNNGNN